MATPRTRNSRVFTISFPENLAQQVEKIAEEESRTISELFREAFRAIGSIAPKSRWRSFAPMPRPTIRKTTHKTT